MLRVAALISLLPAALGGAVLAEAQAPEPTVAVSLNKTRGVDRGDRLRTYVRAEADGYLVVLHAEPDGRIRVLFPIDPGDDHFVRGGRDYEVRSRGDRHSFTVYETAGTGFVYAAFSRDPFQFGAFVLGDHWDYTLPDWYVDTDAEAELTTIVQQLTELGQFDYDLVRYDVGLDLAYVGNADYRLSLYDPYYRGHYWHGHSAFSLSFGFGPLFSLRHYHYRPFRWAYYYDPFYWDPWYYDPWYYDPWYYPAYYYRPIYRSYPRTVYVGGPRGRSFGERRYVFKSNTDRFGLQPDVVQPRRRSVASNASTTTSRRVAPATRSRPSNPPSITGRRTPTSRSAAPAASAGRRAAPAGTTPSRRAAPARREGTERAGADDRRLDQPRATEGARRVTPRSETNRRETSPASPLRRATDRALLPASPREGASGRRPILRPGSEASRPRAGSARRPAPAQVEEQPARSTRGVRPVRVPRPSREAAPQGTRSRGVTPSRTGSRSGSTNRASPTRRTPRSAARPAPRPAPRSAPRSTSRSRPPSRNGGARPSSGSRRSSPPRSSSRSGSRRRN